MQVLNMSLQSNFKYSHHTLSTNKKLTNHQKTVVNYLLINPFKIVSYYFLNLLIMSFISTRLTLHIKYS